MHSLHGPRAKDWLASLVVFIVALPLTLGIALASGAPPASGIIAAIAGGIIAGALAGAPLAVTGPAAGLTAIVFQLIQDYGLAGVMIITFLCGIIQLVMGAFKFGKFFTLIPGPVLEGILSAIGLIIVLGQLHVLMGAGIPSSPTRAALELGDTLVSALRPDGASPVSFALVFGVLAIGIQLLWTRNAKSFWRLIPGALPAVLLVTLLSLTATLPRVELTSFVAVIKNSSLEFLTFGWIGSLGQYVLPALGLAVVASAESLLTARAVDTLIKQKSNVQTANLNRELTAQGAANMISGFIGGIPMTAVMVRSAANVNAGAQTRWSTILHGIWMMLLVLIAPGMLTKIPLSVLAAVLILIGVKLINVKHFWHTLTGHKAEGFVWFATTFAVFTTDLMKGLIIGLVIYCVINAEKILKKMRHNFALQRENTKA